MYLCINFCDRGMYFDECGRNLFRLIPQSHGPAAAAAAAGTAAPRPTARDQLDEGSVREHGDDARARAAAATAPEVEEAGAHEEGGGGGDDDLGAGVRVGREGAAQSRENVDQWRRRRRCAEAPQCADGNIGAAESTEKLSQLPFAVNQTISRISAHMKNTEEDGTS